MHFEQIKDLFLREYLFCARSKGPGRFPIFPGKTKFLLEALQTMVGNYTCNFLLEYSSICSCMLFSIYTLILAQIFYI